MTPAASILDRLLAPHTADELLTHYWPDRWLVVHGALGRLPPLFQARELQDMELLAERYRGRVLFLNGRKAPYMLPIENVSPALLYRSGLTVYLSNVAGCLPEGNALLRQLECEFGISEGTTRMGVFASPHGDGLPFHYDTTEVISIQLRGTKRFDLAPVRELAYPWGTQYLPGSQPFEDLYPQLTNGFPDHAGLKIESVHMQPGSVLFMPRGTWHYTEAGEDSLSISIAVCAPSAVDVVFEPLRLRLLREPAWRRPLYGVWGKGTRQTQGVQQLQTLLNQLPDLAQALTPEETILPTLGAHARLERLTPESWFQRAPNARVEIVPRPGRLDLLRILMRQETVEKETASMEIGAPAVPMFRWLGENQAPFQARELTAHFPALKPEEYRELLDPLLRAGLLRMLWYTPRPQPLSVEQR